jgi:hypothetical protein
MVRKSHALKEEEIDFQGNLLYFEIYNKKVISREKNT